jgi:hypothetical protein
MSGMMEKVRRGEGGRVMRRGDEPCVRRLPLQYAYPAKQLSATTVLAMVAAARTAILEKYMMIDIIGMFL